MKTLVIAASLVLAVTPAQAQLFSRPYFDCIHLSDAMRIAKNARELERLRPYLCHEPIRFDYQWRSCRGLIGLMTCHP
jgi:hypothetical protein